LNRRPYVNTCIYSVYVLHLKPKYYISTEDLNATIESAMPTSSN